MKVDLREDQRRTVERCLEFCLKKVRERVQLSPQGSVDEFTAFVASDRIDDVLPLFRDIKKENVS